MKDFGERFTEFMPVVLNQFVEWTIERNEKEPDYYKKCPFELKEMHEKKKWNDFLVDNIVKDDYWLIQWNGFMMKNVVDSAFGYDIRTKTFCH